jgi:hypothetical protein
MRIIRYALATLCFAASVGCLALWWRSLTRMEQISGGISQTHSLVFLTFRGESTIGIFEIEGPAHFPWGVRSELIDPKFRPPAPSSRFRFDGRTIYFPGWYPALIFALAGVGVLRFRRQFSIRSALIAVTVVAALLGMAVGL